MGKHILIDGPRPKQTRERDIDNNERGRQISDLPLQQPEAGINIRCKNVREIVDDAGVHRPLTFGAAAISSWSAPFSAPPLPRKRARIRAHTASQPAAVAASAFNPLQRISSARTGLATGATGIECDTTLSSRRSRWTRVIASNTPMIAKTVIKRPSWTMLTFHLDGTANGTSAPVVADSLVALSGRD